MSDQENTPAEPKFEDSRFLDMQAALGITKHVGGYAATDELLSLCHIAQAAPEGQALEVLNVGCGIGVGSAYIAKKYGCHVTGVDISEKMIAWSRRRARESKVESLVKFQAADVQALPFEADRFDVVFAESVLIFVEDKAQAIRECVRVTKPGGYVGLCEGFWTVRPSPEILEQVKVAVGPCVPTCDVWRELWDASGLDERVFRTYPVDASQEIKGRIEWIGWPWLLRAWGRALRLILTNPGIRKSIKNVFDVPAEALALFQYGIFVGRRPLPG
jgi:SAM-dependent methyltransferase